MTTKYKIHPAIGIARVGNSPEYYLAPETPGGLPLDPTTNQPVYDGQGALSPDIFRDGTGALKKQAARFKVFVYDDANPNDPGTQVQVGTTTVNGKTVTGIEWTVYLASKKASWFQFEQLEGSGMEGDAGYLANNAANPGDQDKAKAYNPLRFSSELGTSSDPTTMDDPARQQLIFDLGPRTVSGANAAAQEFDVASKGLKPFDIETLGRIKTDADNNLIVLGGEGHSGTTRSVVEITAYANNEGWFDDVSDGSVTASLVLEDDSKIVVDMPSWVICGSPAYAPEIFNLVSLYDTMYDVYVRELGLNPGLYDNGEFQSDYRPNREAEIEPILTRPNLYRYVATIPGYGETAHKSVAIGSPEDFKKNALPQVRRPDQTAVGNGLMPKLAGDNPISELTPSKYLSITQTQYFLLNQFANGDITTTPPASTGEGTALDRASLENCVGGAFCPGIEMTWICRNPTLYEPLPDTPVLSDAFRFRHKPIDAGLTLTNGADNDYSAGMEPGDATKYMAQPWQADFNECSVQGSLGWWWPAQRPYSVFPQATPEKQMQWTRTSNRPDAGEFADLQMVTNWKDLGLILNIGTDTAPSYVEIERNQKAIGDYEPPTAVEMLVAGAGPRKGPNPETA